MVLMLALLAIAAPPTAVVAPAPPGSLRIAVHAIDPGNVDALLARVVTDATVAELRKLQGLEVVAMDEIKAMLDQEAQKQLVGCSDESCLAEIAEALGVDGIVIGTLARVGDETVFGLKRIDQRAAKTVGQSSERLAHEDSGSEAEACLAAVGPAVERLFPDRPLKPGAKRGVDPELVLRVNPPPLSTMVFATSAGAAGVAALATAALFTTNALAYQSAQSATQASVGGKALEGAELMGTVDVVRGTFWGGVAAGALTVGLAATTAVVALFTDWHGYGAAANAGGAAP